MNTPENNKRMYTLNAFYAAGGAYLKAADGDFGPIGSTLHRDCVLHQPGSLPYGGEWRGHDGFAAWMRAFAEVWSALEMKQPEVWSTGDVLISRSHVYAVHRSSGKTLDWPLLQYFRFREGLILDLRPFHWDTAVLVSQLAAAAKP